MPILALALHPTTFVCSQRDEPHVCYALATIRAHESDQRQPVHWAIVADASRSMRVPIVNEAQFRELVRDGGAQETLVDGVPVWQLNGPVPPDMRAAVQSALDYVVHALHSAIERLEPQDTLTLVACAEEALVLAPSVAGNNRAVLAQAVAQLPQLNLGEQTNLVGGLMLAVEQLKRADEQQRTAHILLLTDGFTQQPEACLQLARAAASEQIVMSTIGLGSEFQETLLTDIADASGGRAAFVRHAGTIPNAVAREFELVRGATARAVSLHIETGAHVALRRVSRVRPALAVLAEPEQRSPTEAAVCAVPLGDAQPREEITVLLEFVVEPQATTHIAPARVWLSSDGATVAEAMLSVVRVAQPPEPSPALHAAIAHANVARLQRRASTAAAAGNISEAVRLLRSVAERLQDLNQHELAAAALAQSSALQQTGRTETIATKNLVYGTRRLGSNELHTHMKDT